MHRRWLLVVMVALCVGLAALAGACGSPAAIKGSGGSGGSGGSISTLGSGGSGNSVGSFAGSSGGIPPLLPGLTSLTVTPTTAALTLTYAATIAPVTQPFKATGTFQDGTTKDVTTEVGWFVDPATFGATTAAMLSSGLFSTTFGGSYAVTAASGTLSATATAVVKLTGEVVDPSISSGGKSGLDGTPSGAAPTIAYPLTGALFPFQFGDLAFQVVPGTAGQTIGRIAFVGDAIDLDVYAPCTPIAGATLAGACSIAIPPALEPALAGASEAPNLNETVRLASATGANLAESAAIDARWSPTSLSGTIYYWSTPPMGMSAASEIIRLDLTTPGTPPQVYYTELDAIPYSSSLSGDYACIGCHAISQDGSQLGVTLNGSAIQPDGSGSLFALIDVATKTATATRIATPSGQLLSDGFATLTTFSQDGTNMVQELQGQLFLRAANATLASTGPLFPSLTESLTQPVWSLSGDRLAFTSWVPNLTIPHAYDSKDLNGDQTPGAQIWTAPVTGTTFGTPTLLVPRVANATEYYPAISDDSSLVVFDESSCLGPATASQDGYGASPCDSYDDPSARLRLVTASGGTPVDLDRASGVTSGWPTSDTWTNSWPRFAPAHSTFQGKTLYWVAFSTRRPYGATLAGSANGTTAPQIWFAAVAVDSSGTLSGDPSFAPVWLPLQNSATGEELPDGGILQARSGDGTPTGNHIPQWVVKYVSYVPPATN